MEFKFDDTNADYNALSDKVYAAMETGNTGAARQVLAEHADTFTDAVSALRSEVQREYGIRL